MAPNKDDTSNNRSLENLLQYSHLGIVMFIIMILGWYVGDYFDGYFDTEPMGETIGFFVGLSAAMFYVLREVYRLRAQLNVDDDSDED